MAEVELRVSYDPSVTSPLELIDMLEHQRGVSEAVELVVMPEGRRVPGWDTEPEVEPEARCVCGESGSMDAMLKHVSDRRGGHALVAKLGNQA
jgi:hypothetical protein